MIRIFRFFGILFLTLAIACQQDAPNEFAQIRNDIEQLHSDQEHRLFLENILEEDQMVRGQEGQEIVIKYGKDSKEYMDYNEQLWNQDRINLYKVEKYLAKHGYPDKERLGENAATAPWMVIHHQSEVEPRDKNFEYIYKAYLDQNIDDGAISFYLNRWYEFEKGSRLKMESPFWIQEELDTLIKGLGLEKRVSALAMN